MESSCVRQTKIPGTSALFGDYLYHYERVSDYYPHWFGDSDKLVTLASEIEFPDSRRAALVAALREQNGNSASLDRLANTGTVAVVTGQQVGLFSGPCYTIFKALTAAKLAAQLTQSGVPAVPVFWLATEDHDLAEVDHAYVFDQNDSPAKVSCSTLSHSGGPVGEVVLADLPIEQLRRALGGLPFADEVLDRISSAYRPGATLGCAFREFLQPLLRDFGLLYLDPLAPAMRALALPFLHRAIDQIPNILPKLRRRNKELEQAHYHAQVMVDAETSLLFVIENGKRVPVRWHDQKYVVRDRNYTSEQFRHAGLTISPNALLRPVMQDFMLPTAAYVGGPAEIAYMAQAEVLYEDLLGRMPVIYPRNSMTLLDDRAEKILRKYDFGVVDLFDHHEHVRSRMSAKLVPAPILNQLVRVREQIQAALQEVQSDLQTFDPTLEAASKKTRAKMLFQMEKLSQKTAREAMRRDSRATNDAAYVLNLVYPERRLQERFYSIVPFLAKTGIDLPRRLMQEVQLACPDHMIRVV